MSQDELARVSTVHRNTISAIEREETIPKASTLRLLADGLATDGEGERNPEMAAGYYERLMRAAGYLDDRPLQLAEADRPVDELTDEEVIEDLDRRMGDRDVAVSLLTVANSWRDLPPKSKRMLLEMLRFVGADDDEPSPPRRRRR